MYHHEFNDKISGEVGVQPKIRLSAKDKEDGQSYNEKDNYNAVNAAVVAGILAKITDNLSAGIRAAMDMFNMDSSDGMYYVKNSPDRSLFVTGTLRYSFGSSEPTRPSLPAPPPPPAPAPPPPY